MPPFNEWASRVEGQSSCGSGVKTSQWRESRCSCLELLGLHFLNVLSAHVSGFQSTMGSLWQAHMRKHRGGLPRVLAIQKLGGWHLTCVKQEVEDVIMRGVDGWNEEIWEDGWMKGHEGIDAGKDAEDPWEKPDLRLGSWVSMTSFVSYAAPFEDRRGAADRAIGARSPSQDVSHVHLRCVEEQVRCVSRSSRHHSS